MLTIRTDQVDLLARSFVQTQKDRLVVYNERHAAIVPPEELAHDVMVAADGYDFQEDDDLERLSDLFAWFKTLPPGKGPEWRQAALAVLTDKERPAAARLDFIHNYIRPRLDPGE
ncbi:MAG: hypothetical protein KC731_04755 [Myxococcales bacterium]|nr:hypothetical protein [Myxococcales bacterium]